MTVREMQEEILRLKKEQNAVILAHSYQRQDVCEIADFVGDSFALSKKAQTAENQKVLMCGVRFMAETCKILSPEKSVYLVSPRAGCPMAEQIDGEMLDALKAKYPDYTVVAYINTTAEVKAKADVCVTSSSAVKILENIPNDKILFVPDCNLGDWIQKQLPEKDFKMMHGGCPTHLRMTVDNVNAVKAMYPSAELLVHPECHPSVVAKADFVGSTSEILSYAENGENDTYIIGTENSIVEHLGYSCPEKTFVPLSMDCICHNMALTTLVDVYNCLKGRAGEEITLDSELIAKAKQSIDKMLAYGN